MREHGERRERSCRICAQSRGVLLDFSLSSLYNNILERAFDRTLPQFESLQQKSQPVLPPVKLDMSL